MPMSGQPAVHERAAVPGLVSRGRPTQYRERPAAEGPVLTAAHAWELGVRARPDDALLAEQAPPFRSGGGDGQAVAVLVLGPMARVAALTVTGTSKPASRVRDSSACGSWRQRGRHARSVARLAAVPMTQVMGLPCTWLDQFMSLGTCAGPGTAAVSEMRPSRPAEERPVGAHSSEEAIVHSIDIGPRPGQTQTAAAPAIELIGVERRYGDFHAVRGISFDVHPGEVFALLGVNGAGKTSALEVLEGLAAPSGGSVRILGHDPWRDRAAVRRHLGVLLQHSGLPADLTVRETVHTWARTLTDPRPVVETLQQVDLSGRADVRVRSLSGGERRRLDLALALLGRPRVVVLDEPTTGLDPESRRAVWRIVRDLVDGGAAVLLTTHNLEEAEELADRIAILQAGVVVVAGTPQQISASQPATIRFTVPAGAPPLPQLSGVRVEYTAPHVELSTFALQPALSQLLIWANEHGLELSGLQARAASLERAFLAVSDGAVTAA